MVLCRITLALVIKLLLLGIVVAGIVGIVAATKLETVSENLELNTGVAPAEIVEGQLKGRTATAKGQSAKDVSTTKTGTGKKSNTEPNKNDTKRKDNNK